MYSQVIINRFWNKVDKTSSPDGCWLWTAALTHYGYGRFQFTYEGQNINVRAHKFGWILRFGPVPDGLNVLHKPPCYNRACVFHLYLGTTQQNIDDMHMLERHAHGVTHHTYLQPEKILRGEQVGGSKLTPNDILEIRRHRGHLSQEVLATQFGVTKSSICHIQRGKAWKHIGGALNSTPYQGDVVRHAKLTTTQILEIRARYTGVRGQICALAREYGVGHRTIGNILTGKTWKHA